MGGESLLWQCNIFIREGAASNAQASRTDAKLGKLVQLFQDMIERLDKLEGAHTGKSMDKK